MMTSPPSTIVTSMKPTIYVNLLSGSNILSGNIRTKTSEKVLYYLRNIGLLVFIAVNWYFVVFNAVSKTPWLQPLGKITDIMFHFGIQTMSSLAVTYSFVWSVTGRVHIVFWYSLTLL